MAIFTVHLPPAAAGERPAPESVVFLRDSFSWSAFLFGPLWLLWRRAYAPALAWTVLLAVVALVAWKLRAPRDAMTWVGVALGVWLGFEGARLVAWSLARRGYVESDIVIGDDLDEAEEAFFARWRPPAPAEEPRA